MIYIVQETGWFRSRVKIGYTSNIRGRMPGLRGGSPSKLKLLLLLSGKVKDEDGLHERFAAYRLHGEWFRFGLKLRLFVWLNQFTYTSFALPDETKEIISKDTETTAVDEPDHEPEKPLVKSHPDNINGAIDDLLDDNPDAFPSKGEVSSKVGIVGGSRYGVVMDVYNERLEKWENNCFSLSSLPQNH